MSIKPSDLYGDHSGVNVICALLVPVDTFNRTATLTQQCLRVPCCAARELRTCIRLCKAHVLEIQDVCEAKIRLSSKCGKHAYPRSTNRPKLQRLLIAIRVSATGTRAGQSDEPNMQDLPRGNSRPTYTSLNGSYQPGRVN